MHPHSQSTTGCVDAPGLLNWFAQKRVFVGLSTHVSKQTIEMQKISPHVINEDVYALH